MMIKYRVHEVAKDLNVPSKEIVDLLEKHFGEVKKHMTALTEEELDIVFEHYTQARELPNFDEYFAQAEKRRTEQETVVQQEEESKPAAPEKAAEPAKKEAKPAAKQNAPAQRNANARPAGRQQQNARGNAQKQQPKRQQERKAPAQPQQPAAVQPAAGPSNTVTKPQGRVIDTRSANVNIDKYNEKYDRLASEKMKSGMNTSKKQKITQRSQQRGKPRNSRKETEALSARQNRSPLPSLTRLP